MSLEDFEFGKELGKGAFGSVTIVKRKEDNKIYAMKRVKIGRLGQKEKGNSFNEVRLLASLDHPNIIGYKEAFFDDKSKTLNIVMEYADGGDLSTKIKEIRKKNTYFEEEKIWSTLIQILEGLKYLHQSCIIHRDLKSANIFLTKNGCVKIGDLNVSKILSRMGTASTQTGTPYFASPEIWNDQPYDYKCDIWSVGCIIYEMASLHVPFRGTSMQNLYQNVLRGIYQQIPIIYSNDLKNIIKQILVVNPKNRPSSSELLENRIIKQKMIELGLSKDIMKKNDEKARLMKTIKIPVNMSQINMELPQKKYEKETMLLNDEYETAKRTFYRPPTINNENNPNNYTPIENKVDDNKLNNQINNNNFLDNNINNNNEINNKPLDEKNLVEKLLEKDLNKIQNITKNIENNNYLLNNYMNNNINNNYNNNKDLNNQKVLKNIDNNQDINKNSIIINGGVSSISESKQGEIDKQNPIPLIEYKSKIRGNIYTNNKYSNINYEYIFNEQDNNNRIIKTDMNQVNHNNLINYTPLSKKEEIIKTEISNIDNNFNNNRLSSIKENNITLNIEKENSHINNVDNNKINENENGGSLNNNNNDNNNLDNKQENQDKNNQKDNDFKEKYYKLMEEINQKSKLNNENNLEQNKNINYNDNYLKNDKNKSSVKNIKIEDIDEEILKSKKELEEIDRNLNLLVRNSQKKRSLKYNKSENLLNPNMYGYKNINNNSKNRIDNGYNFDGFNIIQNKNSIKNDKKGINLYRQKQIKKINNNNQYFDLNIKNIRNNRQQINKHNVSLRHNIKSEIKSDLSSINLNKDKSNNVIHKNNTNNSSIKNDNRTLKNSINNSSIRKDNGQMKNYNNNNHSNRYNIFVNYKNDNKSNNINNNYHYKNNYYFNNCNFINNNENDYNYHYKYNYNNDYLRNPYNNNYNQFYKEYFNNFMNYLLKKQKYENNNNYNYKYDNNKYDNNSNNINIRDNINRNSSIHNDNKYYQQPILINNNKIKIDNEINEKNKRKVIYEKINFQKQGNNKYKYFKGPAQVRYVGNGNYYNQCHKAIIKNPIIINPSKQFGIQNLRISGGKVNRNGPRIILPNKMFG